MDWAKRRMWMVILILGGVVLAFVLVLGFAIFYKTPTCTDNTQDGDETGIDCGGGCSTVCSAEAHSARIVFSRTLVQSGRTDLIASIENPNPDSYAKDALLDIDVYREDGHILHKHAIVTLPASVATPLFIPGIAGGSVKQIFTSFSKGNPVWMKGTGWDSPAPKASDISVQNTDIVPKITATVTNQTAYDEQNVPFIATVYSEDSEVIAASQTIIDSIPAQGSAQVVFTWNEPFSAQYSRVEIVPLLALPQLQP